MVLSHHTPDRFYRCLRLRIGRRDLHLCVRCTGQTLEAVLLLFLFALRGLGHLPFYDPWFQLGFVFLPLPAAVDWARQSSRSKESTNRRRLLTGSLLGAAGMDLLILLVSAQWLERVIGAAVLAVYLVVIVGLLQQRGVLERVVEEHFPRATT